ncbi:carbamoyltransferase [Pelagibacterales bacterium SAG-MED16]|nr:carbamoyltransferase [Pelagibacterales bacterium SAG-MED16]|tara:strand:+ start:18962 stop:20668 length:1707 start_codon:yes stop_codon:yes gene_type:complete
MIILGLNIHHPNASACVIKDGKLLFFIEEERIVRIKNWDGFPTNSIEQCLSYCNLKMDDFDHIVINSDPSSNLKQKLFFTLRNFYNISLFRDRLKSLLRKRKTNKILNKKIINVDHHLSHISSSAFISNFESATCLSLDGFGDFCSGAIAQFKNNKINIKKRIYFPHSLGVLYHAITQFLGFKNFGDEYKIMGLTGYGKPTLKSKIYELVNFDEENYYKLNLRYFNFFKKNYINNNGVPKFNNLYSHKIYELLGPERKKDEALSEYYKDLACSLQAVYEEIFFKILNKIYKEQKLKKLCLAGGCALNSLANGKIFDNTNFKEVFIPPYPGDSGGAIGAAMYKFHLNKDKIHSIDNSSPYLGSSYTDDQIKISVDKLSRDKNNFKILYYKETNDLIKNCAKMILENKILGWFQGRMEAGARALGNRSLLANPTNPNIKDIINSKIKIREMFRPFAPSVLQEYAKDYFEYHQNVDYMSMVYKIKSDKIEKIPAVCHVDHTGRLQTVNEKINPIFYNLIKEIYNINGIPMVLNTSLNENEPIVMTPNQAIDLFVRTTMDAIAIGNYLIIRK